MSKVTIFDLKNCKESESIKVLALKDNFYLKRGDIFKAIKTSHPKNAEVIYFRNRGDGGFGMVTGEKVETFEKKAFRLDDIECFVIEQYRGAKELTTKPSL